MKCWSYWAVLIQMIFSHSADKVDLHQLITLGKAAILLKLNFLI